MQLLDRTAERKEIGAFMHENTPGQIRLLQLDGTTGVGKTDLLRYALNLAAKRAFIFEDEAPYHKCRPGDQEQNFSMLSSIIGALAVRHPQQFAGATNAQVRRLSIPPLSQIVLNIVSSLPYVKGVSSSYKADLDDIAESRMKILGLARNSHVTRALTDFCLMCIKREYLEKEIIFAIDDVDWIDQDSSESFFLICRRLAKKSYGVKIIVTSNSIEAETSESSLFEFEKTIRDFPEIHTNFIPVDKLSWSDIQGVLLEMGRDLSDSMITFLYDTTQGNFADLMRLLRQRNQRIQFLFENWRDKRPEIPNAPAREIWIERLRELFLDEPNLRAVFAIFVTLENKVTWREFRALISAPLGATDTISIIKSSTEIQSLIDPLLKDGDVQRIGDYIVADARLLQAAKTLLLEEGVLSNYAKWFARAFQSDDFLRFLDFDLAIERAGRLLMDIDPSAALSTLKKIVPGTRRRAAAAPSALKAAAKAFLNLLTSDCRAIDSNLSFGSILLSQLNKAGEFSRANEVAAALWSRHDDLSDVEREALGIDFLRAAREAGLLESRNQPTGKEIAEMATIWAQTSEAKVMALMTAASVFEHLNDNDSIQEAFSQADLIISNETDTEVKLKLCQEKTRNLGLLKFHGDIVEDYQRALGSTSYGGDADSIATRASHLNHIGLANYHTGKIDEAIFYFESAKKELDKIGVRQETPLNNLASCFLFLNRISEALRTYEQARDFPVKPAYQTLSIDNNYAVCLFKLGNDELALTILNEIADGIREVPDPSIPSHANANLGYIYFKQGKFAEAAGRYAKSNEHEFRFLTKENARLRSMMSRYCAARAGIIRSEDLGDYSFVDLSENRRIPVQRPYQLDLNSLYVI